MKELYSYLLVMVALFMGGKAFAQQFSSEGIMYEVISEENSTARVYMAHRCVKDFEIPRQVDFEGRLYSVIEIEYDSFRYLSCLYVLDLGGVTTLNDGYMHRYEDGAVTYYGSFAYCSSLEKVSFRNLRNLGDYAFYGCEQLTAVDLRKVEVVGKGAFLHCIQIREVTLGESVKTVSANAFGEMEQLKTVRAMGATPAKCAEDAFDQRAYSQAVLIVPAGKKSAYEQAEGWKNFVRIEEQSLTSVEGLAEESTAVKISTRGLVITVEGAMSGDKIRLYDANGHMLDSKTCVGHTVNFSVPRGQVYWVRVGDAAAHGVCVR